MRGMSLAGLTISEMFPYELPGLDFKTGTRKIGGDVDSDGTMEDFLSAIISGDAIQTFTASGYLGNAVPLPQPIPLTILGMNGAFSTSALWNHYSPQSDTVNGTGPTGLCATNH